MMSCITVLHNARYADFLHNELHNAVTNVIVYSRRFALSHGRAAETRRVGARSAGRGLVCASRGRDARPGELGSLQTEVPASASTVVLSGPIPVRGPLRRESNLPFVGAAHFVGICGAPVAHPLHSSFHARATPASTLEPPRVVLLLVAYTRS